MRLGLQNHSDTNSARAATLGAEARRQRLRPSARSIRSIIAHLLPPRCAPSLATRVVVVALSCYALARSRAVTYALSGVTHTRSPTRLLVHASYLTHERPPPLVCLAVAAAATTMPLSLAHACLRARGASYGVMFARPLMLASNLSFMTSWCHHSATTLLSGDDDVIMTCVGCVTTAGVWCRDRVVS